MRSVFIAVPEATARDLVAPVRHDETPTEVRRRDAQEAVAELVRAELADRRVVQSPLEANRAEVGRVTSLLAEHAHVAADALREHIGHRVSICSEGGHFTGARCEDCDMALDTEPS